MDVGGLVGSSASTSLVIAVAEAALADSNEACSSYRAGLFQAIKSEPPPFATTEYAQIYARAASDPRWLAISLITNAEREGDGAKRLWSLSACSPDSDIAGLLKVHAVDESRHALIYLRLLDLAFPGMTNPDFRRELSMLSPHYSVRSDTVAVEGSPYAKAPSIDDFIQMNIAEIRTTIHHLMLRPALEAHTSARVKGRLKPMLDSLLRDELKHVAYTAELIAGLFEKGKAPGLSSLIRRRLRDFNQITEEELGIGSFNCSVACCAKRPECRAKAVSATAFIDAPI
jgi:hypothetical protein